MEQESGGTEERERSRRVEKMKKESGAGEWRNRRKRKEQESGENEERNRSRRVKEQKRETQESCGTEVRLSTRRLEKMKKEKELYSGGNKERERSWRGEKQRKERGARVTR